MPNPTYLSLKEAAKKHNVEEEVLTQLIAAGMIEAVEENGETLVAVDKNGNGNNGKEPQTKEEIIAAKFAHLCGQPIHVTDAAQRYHIPRNTIVRWARRGYINVLEAGYRMELDEADVAYCAYVYNKRKEEGIVFGSRLFDEDGNPYQIKYPDLAKKRRNG